MIQTDRQTKTDVLGENCCQSALSSIEFSSDVRYTPALV